MRSDNNALATYLKAKNGLIYALTYEEHEIISDICQFARKNNEDKGKSIPEVYVYSRPSGLVKVDIQDPNKYVPDNVVPEVKNYNELFQFIKKTQYNVSNDKDSILARLQENNQADIKQGGSCYFILKDLHLFMNNDKDIIRYIRDLKESYKAPNYCPIIVTAPVLEIPPELEKLFTLYEMPLMTTKEIEAKLTGIIQGINGTKQELHEIAVACTGLTKREIDRAIAHSLVRNNKKTIKAEDIHAEKIQIIKKSGVLDFMTPTHTLNDLGGCDNFKEWLKKVKTSITPEAKAFGIPSCKGAMLVGVPGTSKTISAEILASYLNYPLIALDMAKVMGSFVGQSERQISNALRIVESVSPCVLLLDECEKILGGISSSNSTDSGTLSRVMGQILNFLQKENTGVLTIMTSNDVSQLPPELTRTGRIDAQWIFDLPTATERKEIIKIYVNKNSLVFSDEAMEYMVKHSENFTGAELKSAVKDILVNIYNRQVEAGADLISREATMADIESALNNTVTVYRSSKEKIEAFRAASAGKYLNASRPETEPAKNVVSVTKNAGSGSKTVSFSAFKKGK